MVRFEAGHFVKAAADYLEAIRSHKDPFLAHSSLAQVYEKEGKSDLAIDSSDGTILFDRESGQVVDSKAVNRIKGDMTLSINGTDLPAKLDLTLDVSYVRK